LSQGGWLAGDAAFDDFVGAGKQLSALHVLDVARAQNVKNLLGA
jgi:hypothetical protein